jgi:hypothetical protein
MKCKFCDSDVIKNEFTGEWAHVDCFPSHVAMPIEEKPPLGLEPRHIYEEKRINQIQASITRYVMQREDVPDEWIIELGELLKRKKEHDNGIA